MLQLLRRIWARNCAVNGGLSQGRAAEMELKWDSVELLSVVAAAHWVLAPGEDKDIVV